MSKMLLNMFSKLAGVNQTSPDYHLIVCTSDPVCNAMYPGVPTACHLAVYEIPPTGQPYMVWDGGCVKACTGCA